MPIAIVFFLYIPHLNFVRVRVCTCVCARVRV